MMLRDEVLRALLAALLLALLAGCAGYRERSSFAVTISEGSLFSPATLTVAPGGRVTWKNLGTLPQTVTSASESAAWDSGPLYPGEQWTRLFDAPGTYLYQTRTPKSRYHDADGNTSFGVIRVLESGSSP